MNEEHNDQGSVRTIDKDDNVVEEVGHENPVDDDGANEGEEGEEGAEVLSPTAEVVSVDVGELSILVQHARLLRCTITRSFNSEIYRH